MTRIKQGRQPLGTNNQIRSAAPVPGYGLPASGYPSSPLLASRPARGFTLIEVAIALSITALCLAVVVMSYGAVARGHARAVESMEVSQTMNEALERLRILLQAAYLSSHPATKERTKFETMSEGALSTQSQALTFTTLAHTSHRVNAKEADLAEVTLFTVEEPPVVTPDGQKELKKLRVRVGGEINSRFEVEGGLVYTLADHVTQFKLEYLTPESEWKEEWSPADRGNTLPCAIRVTLGVWAEATGERLDSLIVPLEMVKKCQFDDERIFARTAGKK